MAKTRTSKRVAAKDEEAKQRADAAAKDAVVAEEKGKKKAAATAKKTAAKTPAKKTAAKTSAAKTPKTKEAKERADAAEKDAVMAEEKGKKKAAAAAKKTAAKTPAKKAAAKTPKTKEAKTRKTTKAEEEGADKPRSGTKRPRAVIAEKEVTEDEAPVATAAAVAENDAGKEDEGTGERASKHRRLLSYADEVEERKTNKTITRSVPAGGRWWKKIQNEKASMIIYKANPKTLSTSWDRKMELRRKREETKAFEAEQRAKREEHEAMLREKRAEKRRRKAENEFKSGAFQTINPAKLKRMSKKQLRNISKTQVDNDGNVQTVPVYGPPSSSFKNKKAAGKRRR